MNYVMTGTFHTLNILPSETYRNNGVLAKPWIGDATNPYGHIYSQMFHGELDGNAASATKLKNHGIIVFIGRPNIDATTNCFICEINIGSRNR